VRSQQDLAGNSEGVQSVGPAAEMEAALRISGAGAGGEVEIVREFNAPSTIRLQRHRLLQILVNLLKNARQAVDAQGPAVKRLTLRLCLAGDGKHLRFEVADNGNGIAPENVLAVFTRGFTTKPAGHGFGLHSAANTAQDMHGRLFLERTGVGQGSTFVLELPLEAHSAAAA
jgi:two-component system, sensor histidine kinase ChiS